MHLLLLEGVGEYQIDTCLSLSLYLRHGFHSESEQSNWNRVKSSHKIPLSFFFYLNIPKKCVTNSG